MKLSRAMNVMLIDIDSTIPNLALKKCEAYHISKGDTVMWNFPLLTNQMDKIYVSCIFPDNIHLAQEWEGKALIGGTGYDMTIKLPVEIESTNIKINYGFTTRGCIRNCSFCFVPKKEGWIKPVADIYDIWDGKSKRVTLMDNNILALPEHFSKIAKQIRTEKLSVDFNQGLDFLLLTVDLWHEIKSMKFFANKRFAYDHINYREAVEDTLQMMRMNGLKDWESRWYVYVSKDDTIETVYKRIEHLRRHKQLSYVMADKKVAKIKWVIGLKKWTNCGLTGKASLLEAVQKSESLGRYSKYLREVL